MCEIAAEDAVGIGCHCAWPSVEARFTSALSQGGRVRTAASYSTASSWTTHELPVRLARVSMMRRQLSIAVIGRGDPSSESELGHGVEGTVGCQVPRSVPWVYATARVASSSRWAPH